MVLYGPKESHQSLRQQMRLNLVWEYCMPVYHIRCRIFIKAACLRARKAMEHRDFLPVLFLGAQSTPQGMGGEDVHPRTNILILALGSCFKVNPIM
jgi:hypothetical protein